MTLPYSALVDALIAAGVPRDKAESRALAEHPELIAIRDDETAKRGRVLEKQEQSCIVKMARAIGFEVYNLSQPRASKQTPGLPDLWLSHAGAEFAGWFECKRAVGGKRSTAQIAFGEQCVAAKIPYGFGSRFEFAKYLTQYGFTPPPIPQD